MLRAVRTGAPVKGGGVRKEYDDLVATWAVQPRLAELLATAGRPDAGAGRAVVGGAAVPARRRGRASVRTTGRVVFRFQDPAIVEASGLVVQDGLFVTTNDSGDTGRVFTVDPDTGRTIGVTTLGRASPQDVEALAPAGRGEVWVGDIGDNLDERDVDQRDPRARSAPDGPGPWPGRPYELVFPGPARRRGVPAQRTRRPAGCSWPRKEHLRRRPVRRAGARCAPTGPNRLRRVGATLHVRHRRRVLPRREAPGRSATTAGPSSTPSPASSEVGEFDAPRPAAGRGDRGRRRTTGSTSPPRARRQPVLEVTLPGVCARARSRRRRSEPVAVDRPPRRRRRATSCRRKRARPSRDAVAVAAGRGPVRRRRGRAAARGALRPSRQ